MAITFKVGFQVDDKELRTGLQGIQKDIQNAFQIKGGLSDEMQKATQQAMILEKAIKRATTDKGISYYSLTAELNKAGTSAKQLVTTLAAGGQNFQASLNAANSALALADRSVISLSNRIKEMSRVMVQSFKFTAAQSTLQAISNAAQEAYQWVYDLDKTITNIGVVTGYTGDQLDKVTQNAIAGAKELRIAANDYAEGALIFYQQGLGDDEVARRVEITAKSARAAGQSLESMSSQLTAIWNTYQMTGDEMERAASVGAKMAGDTAVDFADIAEAMQTAAAPAEQMGVSYNSLAAIIATVGDTTQQSASVIGNAFKTIFSRFQQLKAEGTDGEVTLNRVSSQLQSLGINVLDASGELRNLDTVIMEVGTQWDSWSQKQQLAVAQLVGGTRQYGQFLTLMQNFDKYQDLLQSANLEDGSALEQQYQSSLESVESYAENAGEAWNRAFSNAIDTDVIKGFYSVVEDVGNLFDSILSSIGGLPGILTIVAGMFSSKIVPGIQTAVKNAKLLVTNLTEAGRVANINTEYNEIDSALTERISTTRKSVNSRSSFQAKSAANTQIQDLQLEQKKNEFSRQTALINEKINTQLKSATGTYKLNLEYQQQQLKSAQELYQASLDQISALQREAEKQKELVDLQERQAKARYAAASAGYDQASAKVIVAEEAYQNARNDGDAAKIRETREALKEANAELDIFRQKKIEAKMDVDLYDTGHLKEFKTALADLTIEYGKLRSSSEGSLSSAEAAFKDFGNTIRTTNPELKQFVTEINRSFGNDNKTALNNTKKDILELGQNSEQVAGNIKEIGSKIKEVASGSLSIDQATQQIQELGGFSADTAGDIEKIIQNYIELRTQNLEKAIADMNELGGTTRQAAAAQEELIRLRSMTQAGENAGQGKNRQTLAGAGVRSTQSNTASGMSKTVEGLGNIASATTMAVGGINMVTSALKGMEEGSMSTGEALLQMVGAVGMVLPSLSMLKGGFTAFQTGMTKLIPALGTASTAASGFGASVAGSFGAAIGAALPFIGIIAAVAAAVGLLVFAWNEYKNTTPEALLDKSKEALEGLNTAAEEAQTAADNLRTTIENYDSAVETLNNCVVGTQEWEDALKHANEAALELVNNLPDNTDLGKIYSRNEETGLIEFDQDKLTEAQEIADQRVVQTKYAAQIGEISVQQATNNVNKDNLANTISRLTGYVEGTAGGTITGASSYAVNKVLEEHINELAETLSAEEFKEKMGEFGVNILQTGTELEGLWKQCQDLADGMQNAADKADLFAQMQVDEILGDNYSAEVKQIAGERLAASTEDWEQKYLGALTNGALGSSEMKNEYGNIYQAQSKIDEQLLADYNDLTGKNWQSSGNGVQGTDTNRIFEFINEEGEIVQLRAEQVAAEMAAAKALEEVTGSAQSAAEALSNIDSEYSDDFNKYITSGNFNSMTEDELNENFELGEDNKVTLESAREYAENVFGGESGLKEMIAATLGKSAEEITEEEIEAYVQEIADGATTSFTALENVGKNLSDNAKAIFDDIDISGASVEAQQKFQQAFSQVYDQFGKEGAESFKNIINQLAPEDAAILAENIDKIDWSNASPEYIMQQFDDLGIEIDSLNEGALSELISLMQQASQIDFSSATEKYKTLSEIGNSVENDMSTINEEQYQTLLEAGIAADAYFEKMADGTYRLKMEAHDFSQMMHDIGLSDMRQFANDSINKYQDLKYLADNPTALASDTSMQLTALEATGSLTQGQISDLYNTDGSINAEKVQEAYAAANISAESIEMAMQGAAQDAEEAQNAIEEADFEFEVEQAGLDLEETSNFASRIAEDLKEEDEALGEVTKSAKDYERQARSIAIANQKLNRGVRDVNENMDEYKEILTDANKGSIDYSKTMDKFKDNLADIFNVADGQLFSDDFAESMLTNGDFEALLDGDVEALNRLRMAATEDIVANIQSNADMTETELANFNTAWNNVKVALAEGLETGTIKDDNFISSLNTMIQNAGMTKDQIQSLLGSMGVDAKIVTDYEEQPVTVPTYYEHREQTEYNPPEYDEQGNMTRPASWSTHTYTVPGEPYETTGYVPVYSLETISGDVSSGGEIEIQNPGPISSNNTTSGLDNSGGGGGSSTPTHSPKKAEKRESMKVSDRYSTVQAAIDDVQRSLDKLDDTSSDMWGGPKLRALQKYNAELWEQAENYKELLDLTERYQEQDKKDADIARLEAGRKLGADLIGIQYNDDNYIANRTEIINQLDDLLQAAYDKYYDAAMAYDASESTSEAESERIDQLKEDYEELDAVVQDYIAALDLSDETAAKHEETLQSLVEMIRREISNRVELITYRIELQTDINDLQIEQIERSIEHLGDVGVLTGKKVGKLADAFRELNDNGNLAVQKFNELTSLLNNLNTAEGQSYFIEKFGQEAWNEYAETGVLPEEIISEMKSSIDEMISAVDDMYSKMEEMFDTYLELLDLYIEKFDQIADKLSRQNDKLDTYQQLLEFSGQQYSGRQGQQARKAIADARISTSQTNLQLSKAEFETYSGQYDEWMAQVEEFQRIHGDDIAAYDEATAAAWNKIDETRQELYNNMQEAEGEIYSNMQELVDNVAEAIEVGAQIIKEQVVESLDGLFNDFESMTETWDQMETLRLFFLEDYDKTYQLDSLLRDVNDAMEDVTDPERMNEYLALIDEINAAQADGVQMTQTDVDLLKAKFELQKAQDAYEQQMNAKTTMRLARDASGNWNYVYSDDQSNQEDAVQALADAQYNYDKLLHEARDESSQLWLQTQQEFFEWQEQIDQSRLQWDTAYREQIQRTYDYYLTLTDRYSNQVIKYNEMLGDNYADTTLGIITQYDTMEQAQADYTQQHAEYNEKLEENTKEYEQVVNDACDEIGIDYDDLANDVYDAANDIMRENDELKRDIWDLQGQASSALSAMSADVWSNVESMIAAIQALEAEIERAIALLEALTQAQLSSSSGGFDANRDYTATGYNAIAGMTEEEAKAFFETDRGQLMAQEWANKVNSELMKGHSFTIGGENYVYGDTATSQDFIDAMIEAVKQGTIEGNKYNEGDTSDVSNKVGDQGSHYNDIYGTPKTASGGLIRTPQVRSVAEDGAELILNNTDTQNILDAVKNMREVVKMKMSNINTNIDKKTEGAAQKTVINKDIQQVDQTVSIDATFPNVSVAAEIEEALNNLINQAVQYATRNNR